MTRYSFTSVCAVLATMLLAACSTVTPDNATTVTSNGSAFEKALTHEYGVLAEKEAALFDWKDAFYFRDKTLDVANGKTVMLANDKEFSVPNEYKAEYTQNHDVLSQLITNKAIQTSAPSQLAIAQASFDCWVEEIEENLQPDMITGCYQRFHNAMSALGVGNETYGFHVYFEHDSAALTDAAKDVLDKVVVEYKSDDYTIVKVLGYTDTTGSDTYNMELSLKRAAAVTDALKANGLDANYVVKSFGEEELQVPTMDGVKEVKNRRVQVILQ